MSKYSIKDFTTQMLDGIISKNPVLVQMLGMCSTLAVTTSVTNALGMGFAVTAVLICSNIFISLLRNFIPKQIRIASYIVIISGFVTAVQLLIKAFLPALDKSLGLFIPLIVVNCIILARAESFASKNTVLPSAVDGLAMGVGFTFALTVLATVREIIGAGSFCGVRIMPSFYEPAIIFILPSGAFLTLGFLIALMNKVIEMQKQRARKAESAKTGEAINEGSPEEAIESAEQCEDNVDEPDEASSKEQPTEEPAEVIAEEPQEIVEEPAVQSADTEESDAVAAEN